MRSLFALALAPVLAPVLLGLSLADCNGAHQDLAATSAYSSTHSAQSMSAEIVLPPTSAGPAAARSASAAATPSTQPAEGGSAALYRYRDDLSPSHAAIASYSD